MKGVIIYKGRYGATEQYARWASEELSLPFVSCDEAEEKKVREADFVIIGSSVYIGKLQASKWLNKNKDGLMNKKIFFYLVAGTPPDQKEKLDGYIKAGVPTEMRVQSEIFYLPGRLRIAGLSWKDRFMLKMGARLTKDPTEKRSMLTDYDHVQKEKLQPLLDRIRKYCSIKKNLQSI